MKIIKRKVKMKFHSLKDLIDFTMDVDINKCEIIRPTYTLITELGDEEIALAKIAYQVRVHDVSVC
jgi:hypothetical protein